MAKDDGAPEWLAKRVSTEWDNFKLVVKTKSVSSVLADEDGRKGHAARTTEVAFVDGTGVEHT